MDAEDAIDVWTQLVRQISYRRLQAAHRPMYPSFQRRWMEFVAQHALQLTEAPPTDVPSTEWRQSATACACLLLSPAPKRTVSVSRHDGLFDPEEEAKVDPLLVAANPWNPGRIEETWWLAQQDNPLTVEHEPPDVERLTTSDGSHLYRISADGNHRTARYQYRRDSAHQQLRVTITGEFNVLEPVQVRFEWSNTRPGRLVPRVGDGASLVELPADGLAPDDLRVRFYRSCGARGPD